MNKTPADKLTELTGAYFCNAICCSGYRAGQNPRENIYPSCEQIKEDLAILRKHWGLCYEDRSPKPVMRHFD